MVKISPSILAADFANLQTEIKKVESCAAMLHIDVMDGHFVPNISVGVPVVASVRKCTNLFLDTHLMISRPQDYIEAFAKAGSDLICFHCEADCSVEETIGLIRSYGMKAAVALKPATPAGEVLPFVKDLDMVLVMTVEPGFGGQAFMPDMMAKVTEIRQYANQVNPGLDIQVDGGINETTAVTACHAGANVLVAGSFVFQSENPADTVFRLSQL
ncbi:MAG: ribulose-phosphate 3-epimerase [Massiliimalia sp.]|jgi:ribulose-phosphate 3-epimerase